MPFYPQAYTADARSARRRSAGPTGLDYDLLEGAFLGATAWQDLLNSTLCPPNRYRWIVVDWFISTADLASIKAQHPRARILAYQNFAGMRVGPHSTVDGEPRPTSLVTYEDANGEGESYFLHKEAGGARIQFADFPDLYAANVNNAGWRTAARQHLTTLISRGYHGAMLDDLNAFPGHGFGEGEANDSTEFASDNAYRDAAAAAAVDLGGYARSVGCILAGNFGGDPWNGDHRVGFTAMLPGLAIWNRESYHSWSAPISVTPFDGSAFADLQAMVAEAERAGVATMAEANQLNPVDHFRMLRFAAAAFHLEWGGYTMSAYAYDNGEPASLAGQYRKRLGVPIEAKRYVAGSVDGTNTAWIRRWTGGVACVNARTAGTGTVTFTLDRPYLDPDGATVASINLDPGYGAVLLAI
jgi:hypothetical protein